MNLLESWGGDIWGIANIKVKGIRLSFNNKKGFSGMVVNRVVGGIGLCGMYGLYEVRVWRSVWRVGSL